MDSTQQIASDLEQLKAYTHHQLQLIRKDFEVLHGQRLATDLWVHALIATHPDPASLKARVHNLVGQIQNQSLDGTMPDRFAAMSQLLQSYGQFFDQVHKLPPN